MIASSPQTLSAYHPVLSTERRLGAISLLMVACIMTASCCILLAYTVLFVFLHTLYSLASLSTLSEQLFLSRTLKSALQTANLHPFPCLGIPLLTSNRPI